MVAGAAVGTVGWGGAQVILPSLTASHPLASLSQLSASGISLSSLSLSTLTSGYRFWQADKVDWVSALAMAVPSVVSARLGSRLAARLSSDALALFFNGFSIILIPTHYWIQQRAQQRPPAVDETNKLHVPDNRLLVQHACFGLVSGVISSLMGVGGLPLAMSYLTESTHLPHHVVQGTAVCALIPSILTSAVSRVASIPLLTAASVAGGAVVGGALGAQLALQLEQEQLRHLYMASLVVFGSRSIMGASRNIQRLLKKV